MLSVKTIILKTNGSYPLYVSIKKEIKHVDNAVLQINVSIAQQDRRQLKSVLSISSSSLITSLEDFTFN